jgi:predicted dehydrogenase
VRITIFGGGSIGQRHAANARALGHEVKIFDKREDRGTNPLNGYAWSQFASEPIDAVLICTPAATHEHVARLLRQYDYTGPLFVEKPIALRSDAPIFRDWPHPVTMVGYNWRFHPEIAPLAGLMAFGGTLHLDVKTDMRQWPGAYADADPILECSHEVDLALHWLGDVTGIHGGSLDVGAGAWLQLQHQRADSIIDLRWRRDPAPRAYTLHLASGTTLHARIGTHQEALGLASSYAGELLHFLEAVRANQEMEPFEFRGCTFTEGLRVVEICARVKELAGL